MKSVIIIPARLESSRLANKLLKDINGKTVIERTVEQALLSDADRVVLATGDSEIANLLQGYNIDVITTPKEGINSGSDRIGWIIKNLDLNYEVIVNVQGDEPFINPYIINRLINDLKDNQNVTMNTVAFSKLSLDEAKNPNVVKVVLDKDNFALYFSRSLIPYNRDKKATTLLKHCGLYGYKKDFLLKYCNMPQSNLELVENLEQLRVLENGYKIKVIKTEHDSIGIDTQEDLDRARQYALKNNL